MSDESSNETTLEQLEGRPVFGSDGDKVGTIADVYFDTDTAQAEWALVTTGLFGTKHSFVPITAATYEGDAVQVPFTKEQVDGAPRIEDDGELSGDEELALADHYGLTEVARPPSGLQRLRRPAGGQ
ncbi:hypothetical protein BH18ACT1_BH18ACT1_05540 [soil metagenome]|nr:PRC-barrel domain-containing protein [Acidimicrobiia bacterium]